MHRCTSTFEADGIEYLAGVTRVADDHEVLRTHGDRFVEDHAGPISGARGETREFTPEETQRAEEIVREEIRQRIAELARDPAHRERSGIDPRERARRDRDTGPGHEDREAGLRALERMQLSAEAGDRLDDLIRRDRAGIDSRYIAAVSDPHYERAFWKRILRPDTAHQEFDQDEAKAVRVASEVHAERAMAEGVGSTGGFGVPYALDPTIMLSSSGSQSPLRELATVTTITTRTWQGVSSEGVTAAFSAEATEASDDSPTLAQPTINAEKWQAFVPFSIELGQDYDSLQEELGRLFADARDELEASKFTSGAGSASNEPQGLTIWRHGHDLRGLGRDGELRGRRHLHPPTGAAPEVPAEGELPQLEHNRQHDLAVRARRAARARRRCSTTPVLRCWGSPGAS